MPIREAGQARRLPSTPGVECREPKRRTSAGTAGPRLRAALASLAMLGCSVTKLAVSTQAEVMELASPVVEAQTDAELVRSGAAANLLQVEGLLRVSPDDDRLLLLAVRGWASYAFGFLEDDMERAEAEGDLERADQARSRARRMYLHAKQLGFRLLEGEAEGLEERARHDPESLANALSEHFDDRDWAPALFWTGYAWGSAINVSRDDPALLADLPFATLLVERSLALDESNYNAAAHVFLGVASSSRGESIGGDLARGKKHFERALELTNREALMVQLNYAQSYAVQTQDRALFDRLLNEVLDATVEAGSPVSLANTLAQRRGQRLRAQADLLILPPPPPELPENEPVEEAPTTQTKEDLREAS